MYQILFTYQGLFYPKVELKRMKNIKVNILYMAKMCGRGVPHQYYYYSFLEGLKNVPDI